MTEQNRGANMPYEDRLRAANMYVGIVHDMHRDLSDPATKTNRLLPGENVPAAQTLLRHTSAQGMRKYAKDIAVPLGIEKISEFDLNRPETEVVFTELGFFPQRFPHGDIYFHNWMGKLMTYHTGLNVLKNRTVGRDSTPAAQNYISCLVTERVAWLSGMARYGELKDDPEIPTRIEIVGRAVMQQKDKHLASVGVRTLEYGNYLRNVGYTLQHLERLPGPLTVAEQQQRIAEGLQFEIVEPEEQVERLRAANDALFERTKELQQYGVKSAIAPSLLPKSHRLMNEWLVVDPDSEHEGLENAVGENRDKHSAQFLSRPAATFYGTADRFVSSNITYGMGEEKYPHQDKPFAGAEVGAVTEHAGEPGMAIVLGRDGELKTLQGYDIREFIEHSGAGMFELEVMRAEILSIYTDLVTPVYVNDLATHHATTLKAEQHGTKKGEPTMRELVLARSRVIDVFHDDIVKDLESEKNTNTITETQSQGQRLRRIMEKHIVVGHTRRIPSTHRASPIARKIAWDEAGVTLPEYGLTWERRHARGGEQSNSKGHQAKMRNKSQPREVAGVDFVDLDALGTTVYTMDSQNASSNEK